MSKETVLDEKAPRAWNMLIGKEWVEAEDGERLDVITPLDHRQVIATIPRGNKQDVEKAVHAARAAFPAWSSLSFMERATQLHKCADALHEATEELAQLTALDTGNAIRTQARPEAAQLSQVFRYFAGLSGEVKGVTLPQDPGSLEYTKRVPLGVVAGILPWNSPLAIAGLKTPSALAAGNTLILKAAEDAPLSILRMAEICAEILPPGVLNVVTGIGNEVGEALVRHPDVDKVSFTGSTAVGRHIAKTAGERLAKTSLELGGKSPTIVFPDSCTEKVVDEVVLASRFARQSQSCTTGSRLFLHEDIHDRFLEMLVDKVRELTVGDPRDEATDIGCVINEKQLTRIQGYIDGAINDSSVKVWYDGRSALPEDSPGYFSAPVILSGVGNNSKIAQEEVFGPVISAMKWSDEDELLDMANDSEYGLAAFIFTENLSAATRLADRINSGWIQVNQGGGQKIGQSYGGMKASGIGREMSLEGMLEGFTAIKQVNIRV